MVFVNVYAGNAEQAIKNLKRKMQRELVFRAMRAARFYETPSERRVRKLEESEKRIKRARRAMHN